MAARSGALLQLRRLFTNLMVAGSNPAGGKLHFTIFFSIFLEVLGLEHFLTSISFAIPVLIAVLETIAGGKTFKIL